MWLFYLVAVVILIIGLLIWIFNKRITWQEWIGSAVGAFIIAGIFHLIAVVGLTSDYETWSGRVTHAEHYPRWVEEYQQRHEQTYTTGSGKNQQTHTRVWYTTEHDTHPERWFAYFNYGTDGGEQQITKQLFDEITHNFNSKEEFSGKQSSYHLGHFDGGDNSIYGVKNNTGYIYPVTKTKHFENRIKAAPTVFSFPKVPTNCPVYLWPENPNRWVSDRLLGEGRISILEFDRMNSRLGPMKLVNVIMINFGTLDSSIAQWQQAKWIGGKKNDIVICYGQVQTNGLPTWSRVFGWSESEIAKRNIETIMLTTPASDKILPLIETEIKKNYTIKDWSKFDYITIEPPTWAYITYFILVGIIQIGLFVWFNLNEFDKEDERSTSYTSNYLR